MTDQCEAVRQRAELTLAIQKACSPQGNTSGHGPADGSEMALAVSFSILHGIVQEYLNGGDQMAEGCDCGNGLHRYGERLNFLSQ
jgi:hypothetical protein